MEVLRTLPAGSVHCCVTSPPYWGLRDYGMEEQVGLEESPEAYVEKLVYVFREVRRVLRPDGVLWINLGDSYAQERGHGYWGGKSKGDENKQKTTKRWASVGAEDFGFQAGSLMGLPWRVALALQEDGWILRSDAIWAKRNMLPESVAGWRWERCRRKVKSSRNHDQGYVQAGGHRDKTHGDLRGQPSTTWEDCPGCARCSATDGRVLRQGSWRPTRSHEYVFMLAKSPGYYASGEEVREAAIGEQGAGSSGRWKQPRTDAGSRNLRDVWVLTSQPSALRHFAMMPPALVEKCLRSSCPSQCCGACGAPHAPLVDRVQVDPVEYAGKWAGQGPQSSGQRIQANARARRQSRHGEGHNSPFPAPTVRGFRPTCGCGAATVPGTVLDPFLGAGTVASVAEHLGFCWEGVELNPEYARLLPDRIAEVGAYYARRAGRKRSPTPSAQDIEQLGLFGTP